MARSQTREIENYTRPESTRSMFEQAFKNIDDVFWKEAECTTELDYTEQTRSGMDARG